MQHWELLFFFGLIAFVYASVGFGGASSYLALLAVYQLPVYEMKLTALLCNIIVVTSGSILFIIKKHVNFKKILPLVALSVPAAYLGALMKLNDDTFFIILGTSLIIASLLLVFETKGMEQLPEGKGQLVKGGIMGAGIGFLSGMVGIGGGIFLSPLLNLTRWDVPRKIAATASVFILVNSISGLVAHFQKPSAGPVDYWRIAGLGAVVFIGGQLGSRLGIMKFAPLLIRRVTAVLVFAAGVQVLQNHLHLHG